jgi:hypothetical protein
MASPEAHIAKAKHNIKTIALLSRDLTKKDWIVTVAFYAALHIVDTVLFHKKEGFQKHGQSHDKREEIIKNDTSFQKIYDCYRPLLNQSIIARYLQGFKTPPGASIDFDKVMPNGTLIAFIKEKLGGIIKAASTHIPQQQANELEQTFQIELKGFLSL